MSYTPTVWKDGDVVTSQKLNKIEEGIANNITVVLGDMNDGTLTLNMTYRELNDKFVAGGAIILLTSRIENGTGALWTQIPINGLMYDETTNTYGVFLTDPESGNAIVFNGSNADDYPTYNPNGTGN